MEKERKNWITLDEEENECLTLVHQADCENQIFSENSKEFVCTRFGCLCNERCPKYSGITQICEEYEELPQTGVEISTLLNLRIRRYNNGKSGDIFDNLSDGISDPNGDDLLEYLENEIW